MNSKVYSVWCEWDIGQKGNVFISEELARQWILENENLWEVAEDSFDGSISAIFKAGLVGVTEEELYK